MLHLKLLPLSHSYNTSHTYQTITASTPIPAILVSQISSELFSFEPNPFLNKRIRTDRETGLCRALSALDIVITYSWVMSYSNPNPNPENFGSPTTTTSSPEAVPELKLYQAFIFSVPICFTFILLFLFYLIYLRRRSVDWSSLGMRSSFVPNNTLLMAELGLSKEVREMLPIVVYNKSFSVTDSQCSVCLGDYQADDKLQQIPACGHTFHMDCIDQWLTTHTTCPLCRLSLVPKSTLSQSHHSEDPVSITESTGGASARTEPQSSESVNHSNDCQERPSELTECIDREAVKEKEKDERNSVGTSDACRNSRPG